MSGAAKNEAKTEGKKNKTVIILAVVFAVVVVALIGVIIYLLNRGRGDADGPRETPSAADNAQDDERREIAGTVRPVLDENSAMNIMDQMREEVAEGMFECQMTYTWTFTDGGAESRDSYVANSPNNTHPICFDVFIKGTEELLYSSPVLPVGTELTNIKLDRELSAGEYEAVVMYSLLTDEESQEKVSGAGFVVTIIIQN